MWNPVLTGREKRRIIDNYGLFVARLTDAPNAVGRVANNGVALTREARVVFVWSALQGFVYPSSSIRESPAPARQSLHPSSLWPIQEEVFSDVDTAGEYKRS